jgi:hypothetical protein
MKPDLRNGTMNFVESLVYLAGMHIFEWDNFTFPLIFFNQHTFANAGPIYYTLYIYSNGENFLKSAVFDDSKASASLEY